MKIKFSNLQIGKRFAHQGTYHTKTTVVTATNDSTGRPVLLLPSTNIEPLPGIIRLREFEGGPVRRIPVYRISELPIQVARMGQG